MQQQKKNRLATSVMYAIAAGKRLATQEFLWLRPGTLEELQMREDVLQFDPVMTKGSLLLLLTDNFKKNCKIEAGALEEAEKNLGKRSGWKAAADLKTFTTLKSDKKKYKAAITVVDAPSAWTIFLKYHIINRLMSSGGAFQKSTVLSPTTWLQRN